MSDTERATVWIVRRPYKAERSPYIWGQAVPAHDLGHGTWEHDDGVPRPSEVREITGDGWDARRDREILRLAQDGYSFRAIAVAVDCGKERVGKLLRDLRFSKSMANRRASEELPPKPWWSEENPWWGWWGQPSQGPRPVPVTRFWFQGALRTADALALLLPTEGEP